VNFLSDVAAGWVVGLLWALACLWWCQAESTPTPSPV
jgi:membrane-associated phospholipid phosphatase